jgi:alpha-tubulin suppressor-like RCC1 family protein
LPKSVRNRKRAAIVATIVLIFVAAILLRNLVSHRGSFFENSRLSAVQIAVGENISCALLNDDSVRCWGETRKAHLGSAALFASTPLIIRGIDSPISMCMGDQHGCARLRNSSVTCWGSNSYGQLGNGSAGSAEDGDLAAIAIPSLRDVVQIACGGNHTCALIKDGTVQCWGENYKAQSGKSPIQSAILTPTPVDGLASVQQISLGGSHSCALLADSSVRCWGDHGFGQLGSTIGGPFTERPVAVIADGLGSALIAVDHLALGSDHSCAAMRDRSVRCWGRNSYEQLGFSGPTTLLPRDPGISGVVNVFAGCQDTCVTTAAGGAQCWGQHHNIPDGESAGTLEIAIACNHSCIRSEAGEVHCWGDNVFKPSDQSTAQDDVGRPTIVKWGADGETP